MRSTKASSTVERRGFIRCSCPDGLWRPRNLTEDSGRRRRFGVARPLLTEIFAMKAGRFALITILSLGLVALAVGLSHRGWTYYGLSLEARVEHPDFGVLRPSGTVALGYGYIAAALVVLNLAYLVRRRIAGTRMGSMKVWLDLHVFTGLTAAVLVSFHSSFQLRTPIARTCAYSLAVVVVTGVIGRFLYAFVPAADSQRLADALDGVDAAAPGSRGAMLAALELHPAPRISPDAWIGRCLVAVPRWRRVARSRRRGFVAGIPPRRQRSRELRAALRTLIAASDAEARSSGMTALLRSWRGFHRFFAFLMLLAAAIHAGVAWHYGYRWIFA